MHKQWVIWAAACLSAVAGDAQTFDPAAAFGAREKAGQVSLSPDGTKAAIISAAAGSASAVVVANLTDGSTRTVLTSTGRRDKVTSCRWATANRLVCYIYLIIPDEEGRLLGYSRALVMDADGRNAKQLSNVTARAMYATQSGGSVIDWTGDGKGAILMTRRYVPQDRSEATGIRDEREGLGVDLVDVTDFSRKTVERPRLDAVEYISDGKGTVRIMGTRPSTAIDYAGDRLSYFYRTKGSRDWKPLGQMSVDGVTRAGFNPYAVDSDLDVVYGFELKDGREALYKISLDGSMRKEQVLAHTSVDIDDLIQIGRQRRVVGAGYATDVRQAEFFDTELAKLRTALGKALPGDETIAFLDASADERKLLLYAGSDIDPGQYYLFDKDTKKLAPVVPVRPELTGRGLAPMKAISFKAADGTSVPGYLTLPPGSDGKGLPAIVMPHGGPGARDEWGFDPLVQFFAARGYAVLQPNFRGSAGFGQDWFQKNGFQSWRTAIGDVNDAGRYLVQSGVAAPSKLAVFGWSYGGYAALQSAVLDADLYKAIVAVAPVTDLETLREDARGFSSFRQTNRFIGTGPEVKAGSPAQNAARIKAPVLMFHGDRDQNVPVAQSRMMRDRLKSAGKAVTYLEYPMLDHQLDDSAVRTELLRKSDAHIRAALGL